MKLKILIIGIILSGLLLGLPSPTAAETLPPQITEKLDLTELNLFVDKLDADVYRLLPELDPASWEFTGPDWNLAEIGREVIRYFFRELVFNFRLLSELFLLAVILAVLQNIQNAFENDTVNRIAFGLCFLIVIGLVLNSYRVTFAIAGKAITQATDFIYALIPLLFSLIVAGGGVSTAAIVHPVLVSAVALIARLVKILVFPLILYSGIVGIVGYCCSGFQLSKLAALLKNIALGILGVAMTVFVGVVAVRGLAASVADSMSLRTAKFFSTSFLPVVGRALSDTAELVIGCSMVLKSGLGLFGLGLIALIIIFPLIKILAVGIIYYLTSVLIQQLGSERLADALQTVGETFINLFGAVAITGFMFFTAISILLGIARIGMG